MTLSSGCPSPDSFDGRTGAGTDGAAGEGDATGSEDGEASDWGAIGAEGPGRDWFASRLIRSRASSSELVARLVAGGEFRLGAFISKCEFMGETRGSCTCDNVRTSTAGHWGTRGWWKTNAPRGKHRSNSHRCLVNSPFKEWGCGERNVRTRMF